MRLPPLAFILFLFFSFAASASEASAAFGDAPKIESLSHRDSLFRQYSEDVRKARIALASSAGRDSLAEKITFYSYTAKEGDDLLSIAARSSVPYESIATLNRMESASASIAGRTLLLPSMPGLYMPIEPKGAFEELLAAELSSSPDEGIWIGDGDFLFFPGKQLGGTARTFFLVTTFRFPLPEGVLTSSFGERVNPVTGNRVFHRGIDLAAPEGTPVYACASGVVIESAYSEIYGNYIILRHSGGRESLYGHLSSKSVEPRDEIKSGAVIGGVGSTGQSTGPHLHFEIHENGVPRDPEGLLRQKAATASTSRRQK